MVLKRTAVKSDIFVWYIFPVTHLRLMLSGIPFLFHHIKFSLFSHQSISLSLSPHHPICQARFSAAISASDLYAGELLDDLQWRREGFSASTSLRSSSGEAPPSRSSRRSSSGEERTSSMSELLRQAPPFEIDALLGDLQWSLADLGVLLSDLQWSLAVSSAPASTDKHMPRVLRQAPPPSRSDPGLKIEFWWAKSHLFVRICVSHLIRIICIFHLMGNFDGHFVLF